METTLEPETKSAMDAKSRLGESSRRHAMWLVRVLEWMNDEYSSTNVDRARR